MSKTNKRRRAINVNRDVYDALKDRSSQLEGVTYTKLATLIAKGEHPPLSGCNSGSLKHSVSMTEAMWLAVKGRGDYYGKATARAFKDLLIGDDPPLTAEELAAGRAKAEIREAKRAAGDPEEMLSPRAQKEKTNGESVETNIDPTTLVKSEIEDEKEKEKMRRMKLPKGQSYETTSTRPSDTIEPDEEFYGGVRYL